MTRIAPSWIVAIALTGVIQLATAQVPAFVPQNKVASALGGTSNFTCRSNGIPMSTCLWERDPRPGGQGSATPNLINFNAANAKPGEAPADKPGYLFLGEGLEKGECGLSIQNVKEEDDGNWKCTLITNSGLYRGVVELEILRKPTSIKFNPSVLSGLRDDGRSDEKMKVICFAENGHPAPKFQWFIDSTPVPPEALGKTEQRTENGKVFTFQELHNYKFSWRDNGKKLRCVMQHEALTANDQKEVQLDIDVEFPPRSSREDGGNHVSVRAEIGTEKVLSVNVSANPRPDQVTWTVDGKIIRDSDLKYKDEKLRDLGNGMYQANLKIISVAEDDINKKFMLTVNNPAGTANFDLKISSDSAGGLSAGGIVLLILGIAALLIVIALVVVYTRSQGMLCFKGDDGTASEKERMDGGSTGGTGEEQPAQQKPGLKLTSRLTALYDNLLNKKKDKAVPADEESAVPTKETKESGPEPSSPVKPPGTPANPPPSDDPTAEKKADDIVYAELDLARSGLASTGGSGNPEILVRADDKTEYAEIVGVVGKVEDAKKSPSASNKSSGSAKEK